MRCKNGVRIIFIVLCFSFLCDILVVHVHHNLFYVMLFPVDVLNVLVTKNVSCTFWVFFGGPFSGSDLGIQFMSNGCCDGLKAVCFFDAENGSQI